MAWQDQGAGNMMRMGLAGMPLPLGDPARDSGFWSNALSLHMVSCLSVTRDMPFLLHSLTLEGCTETTAEGRRTGGRQHSECRSGWSSLKVSTCDRHILRRGGAKVEVFAGFETLQLEPCCSKLAQ